MPECPVKKVVVVSDIHLAEKEERERGITEFQVIKNPCLRLAVRFFRYFIWNRDPFSHETLLKGFLNQVEDFDYLVANGDFSCDTAFLGVSDPPSFLSAAAAIKLLKEKAGHRLLATMGDHEIGKQSLFGGKGGLRLKSLEQTRIGLGIEPFWSKRVGSFQIIGLASPLVALPVYLPETLPEERDEWEQMRKDHLDQIYRAFDQLAPEDRVILFCHDPTALPFLLEIAPLKKKVHQIEATIIGHLHSNLILRLARLMAGFPTVPFCGTSIKRITGAINRAKTWKQFKVTLCPSLSGIQLLKDGGFLTLGLHPDPSTPPNIRFHALR